jgi:hypothetical protein
MLARSLALFCLMLLALSGCATKSAGPLVVGDRAAALSGAILVVSAWGQNTPQEQPQDTTPLYNQLKILKASFAAGEDDDIRLATLYYIAEIEADIVSEASIHGEKVDRAMAQEALTDLDIVLARNQDIPEWRVSVANANYIAGDTVYAMDGMTDLAKRYWNACAKMGHAGCVNNIANELLNKPTPSDDDIRNALGLHAGVVKTGIEHRCAGEYSALSMAMLMHFTGIRLPGSDDEIKLLDTARDLYHQYQEASHTKDPCGGGRIWIDQYLMYVDRGEHHEILLDEVARTTTSSFFRLMAGYLGGKASDAQMIGLADKATGGACGLRFYLAWRLAQNGDRQGALAQYKAMRALPFDTCGQETMMMRYYLKQPANG